MRVRKLTVLVGLSLLAAVPALAATSTWNNGNGTSLWNDAANWSAGVPGAGDIASFDNTSVANCTIDMDAVPSTVVVASNYSGEIIIDGTSSLTVDSIFIGGGTFTAERPVTLRSFVTSGTPTITAFTAQWYFIGTGIISTDRELTGSLDISDGAATSIITTLGADLTAGMVVVRQADTLAAESNQTLTISPLTNNFLPSDNGGVVMPPVYVDMGASSRTHDGTILCGGLFNLTGNSTAVTLTRSGTAALYADSVYFSSTANYIDDGGTTTCRSFVSHDDAAATLTGTVVFTGEGVIDSDLSFANLTVAGTNAALTVADELTFSGDLTVGASDDTLLVSGDVTVAGSVWGTSEFKSGSAGTATNLVVGDGAVLTGLVITDVHAVGSKPMAVGCIPNGNVVGITFRR